MEKAVTMGMILIKAINRLRSRKGISSRRELVAAGRAAMWIVMITVVIRKILLGDRIRWIRYLFMLAISRMSDLLGRRPHRKRMKERRTRIMRIITIKMKMILFNSWKMKMMMRMEKKYESTNDDWIFDRFKKEREIRNIISLWYIQKRDLPRAIAILTHKELLLLSWSVVCCLIPKKDFIFISKVCCKFYF